MKVPTVKLNNNVEIPIIGNGPGGLGYKTSQNNQINNKLGYFAKHVSNKLYHIISRKKYINAVSHSLQIGFTLLDFSVAYGNELLIGKAIKKSGIKREDLFLTTRVSNNQQQKKNIREQLFNTFRNCW